MCHMKSSALPRQVHFSKVVLSYIQDIHILTKHHTRPPIFSSKMPNNYLIRSLFPELAHEDQGNAAQVLPSAQVSSGPAETMATPRVELSLSSVIFKIISHAPNQQIRVKEIYDMIETNYLSHNITKNPNWKNTVRQTLSTNKHFMQVPRSFYASGKGDYWTFSKASKNAYIDMNNGKLRCASITGNRQQQPSTVNLKPAAQYNSYEYMWFQMNPRSAWPQFHNMHYYQGMQYQQQSNNPQSLM